MVLVPVTVASPVPPFPVISVSVLFLIVFPNCAIVGSRVALLRVDLRSGESVPSVDDAAVILFSSMIAIDAAASAIKRKRSLLRVPTWDGMVLVQVCLHRGSVLQTSAFLEKRFRWLGCLCFTFLFYKIMKLSSFSFCFLLLCTGVEGFTQRTAYLPAVRCFLLLARDSHAVQFLVVLPVVYLTGLS